MANDRIRRNVFATHWERLMQNDRHPSSIINLGLGGLSLFEDDEGAVTSYDIKLHDEDGRPGRISNRSFNTIHRLLEAYGDSILGQREVIRSLKVQRHMNLFPAAFYSFVETFSDTKFTEDGNDECVFNGIWSPPTTNPPVAPVPPTAATFAITGSLEHNAYEGSITHLPDSSETASAGTYRTVDLIDTGITQGLTADDYWLPNHFEAITAANFYSAIATYTAGSLDAMLNEGVYLIVSAHGNNAFWDGYWETADPADADITADETHTSKNRITIYPYETGGGVDASKKLIYFPHVPATTTYGPTETADPGGDTIWGKIINVENPRYKPNEGIAYASGNVHPINYLSSTTLTTTSTEVEMKVPAYGTFLDSDASPSGFINDEGGVLTGLGTPTALRVDVTLGPNAKLYSFGIHAVRARDWIMYAAGGLHAS